MPNLFRSVGVVLAMTNERKYLMKKLLAVTALTVLTASSAFATTYHSGWRAQGMQSYAAYETVSPPYYASYETVSPGYVVSSPYTMVTPRDAATRPYSGWDISRSSVVQ